MRESLRHIVTGFAVVLSGLGIVEAQEILEPSDDVQFCTDMDFERFGGQQSNVNAGINKVRAIAEGGFLTLETSFAEVGKTFVLNSTSPKLGATLKMGGIRYAGFIQDFAAPGSGVKIHFILRDLDSDQNIANVVIEDVTVDNGLGLPGNPLGLERTMEVELVRGVNYAALLRLETFSQGAAAFSDYGSGDRGADFGCISIRIACDLCECVPADESLGGQGCNRRDDDCDSVIDDCAEDQQAPTVHIDAAVANPWFRTLAEASAAVAQAVHAFDDCREVSVSAPVVAGACDVVDVQVTATDDCNNGRAATVRVRVDGIAPSIAIPPSVANMCFATVEEAEQVVLANTVLGDDCTPVTELDVRVDSTVTECRTRVRIEAIDHAGNRSVAAITVRVDVERPVVDIDRLELGFRGAPLGFQTPRCFADVDAAEESVLAAAQFRDNCSAEELIGQTVVSAGDPCSLAVTVGGEDECANTNTDEVTVRVDAESPMVGCTVTVGELWPPSHEMVDVGFDYTANDNCPGELSVDLLVTSDEDPGVATLVLEPAPPSGAVSDPCSVVVVAERADLPDAEIIRDLENGGLLGLRLRAERAAAPPAPAGSPNSGNGRVYQIRVRAADPCGNVSTAQCTVTVPVACGVPAVDDGQRFDATAGGACPSSATPVPIGGLMVQPLAVTNRR